IISPRARGFLRRRHTACGAPLPRRARVYWRACAAGLNNPLEDVAMSPSLPDAAAGSQLPGPTGLASLAEIAHELRTPLTAMAVTAELLSEDLAHLDSNQVRQMVATLHRSTVRLHQLVENLHAFTAPGAPPGAPVDLRAVLHETECVLGLL